MDHKKLQRASRRKSGVYIFSDGVCVFTPLGNDAAIHAAFILIRHGDVELRNVLEKALKERCPVVPSLGEGTHGAYPDNQ